MIDADALAAERRRFFLATKGGVWFPLTGAAFWTGLGTLGFVWSPRTWCLVTLWAGAAAIPVGIAFFAWLGRRLAPKSALATLVRPALLPVALSLGIAVAAYRADPSLVPLALVVGLASHWPAVGWMFDTVIYPVHAVVRVGVAVSLWMLFPGGRFTWMPISVGLVYALTALWLLRSVGRLQATPPPTGAEPANRG